MQDIIRQKISDSILITDNTKDVLCLYLDSNETVGALNLALKEEHLNFDRAHNLEEVNEQIKANSHFNYSDISTMKKNCLAARLTEGLETKPVFARVIENRYLEQITTWENHEFVYLQGKEISSNIKDRIRNLSDTLGNTITETDMKDMPASMYRLLSNTSLNTLLNGIEYSMIERTCVDLFANNYEVFHLFVDKIDNIENLSSTIFNSITFKICLKLTPLLASKFIFNYNTDEKVHGVFKEIHKKAQFRHHFDDTFGRTKLFLVHQKRELTCGFLGLTLGTMVDHSYFSKTTPVVVHEKTVILPVVQGLVDQMETITENTKLTVFTLSNRVGETIDDFYRKITLISTLFLFLSIFFEGLRLFTINCGS
jgi:hypothetical protein